MKKLVMLAVFATAGLLHINAQSDKGDFTLAPQLGINFSSYASEADFSSLTSITAGVITDYYFSDRWSLRSGLILDAMGAEDSFNNSDKLTYLTLPINANWHFGSNRNWYLNFGPAVAFLVNAKSELTTGEELDIKDFVPGIDIGLTVGIGYKFDVSEDIQLYIDYQGYGGFLNVDDSNSLPYELRNTRSAFNVGAVFQL